MERRKSGWALKVTLRRSIQLILQVNRKTIPFAIDAVLNEGLRASDLESEGAMEAEPGGKKGISA